MNDSAKARSSGAKIEQSSFRCRPIEAGFDAPDPLFDQFGGGGDRAELEQCGQDPFGFPQNWSKERMSTRSGNRSRTSRIRLWTKHQYRSDRPRRSSGPVHRGPSAPDLDLLLVAAEGHVEAVAHGHHEAVVRSQFDSFGAGQWSSVP